MANPKCTSFSFCGFDSLCFMRFMQFVLEASNGLYRDRCIVYLDGKKIGTNGTISLPLLGKPYIEPLQDGYIRTIYLECLKTGEKVSIGGDNATKEDVAAKELTFFIIGTQIRWDEVDERSYFLRQYEDGCAETLTQKSLDTQIDNEQYLDAAATAKKLNTMTAALSLLECLEKVEDEAAQEMVADAFRSFECPLKQADESDVKLIADRLGDFALNRLSGKHGPEPRVPAIYAIESLGYIGRASRNSKQYVADILDRIANSDDARGAHYHVIWAAAVSQVRLTHPGHIISLLETALGNYKHSHQGGGRDRVIDFLVHFPIDLNVGPLMAELRNVTDPQHLKIEESALYKILSDRVDHFLKILGLTTADARRRVVNKIIDNIIARLFMGGS